jgi:hypothetical protein
LWTAAANVMARDPAALQLRLLQTVVEVAGPQAIPPVQAIGIPPVQAPEIKAPETTADAEQAERP